MSSEQVIAEVVAEMRTQAERVERDSLKYAECAYRVDSETLRDWIDRLSTPAASTGDDPIVEAFVTAAPQFAPFPEVSRGILQHVAGHIRQLQARNAEQAAELVRLRAEVAILENNLEAQESCTASISAAFDRINDSRAALLDGIEGLEAKWRRRAKEEDEDGEPEQEAGSITRLNLCAAELQALRESSVPAAPNPEGSGAG